MFAFYLDNTLVHDPINWAEFTETTERDAIVNGALVQGLLSRFENKLTFTGDGYKLLHDLKVSDGYCNLVDIRIEKDCKVILRGFVSISRCIFYINRCVVECEVVDNNFGALIFNNKSIKTSIGSDKSKTGVTINQANSYDLILFDPATGTYTIPADARSAYTISETFRYLIAFMTDGTVGFESDFFDLPENLAFIIDGQSLRTNIFGTYPIISFAELFKEVYNRYNIGFTVVDRNGIPTMKIENAEYFYNATTELSINNIPDLKESYNPELLYSGIKLGGETVIYDPTIHSIVPRQFAGFLREEYYYITQCNIDKLFDIENEWINDTNIIQELAYTNQTNKTYDKNIFLIEANEVAGIFYATKFLVTDIPAYMYNNRFTNEQISLRFLIYGDATLYSGLDTNSFRAERTNYVDTGNLATAANGWNNPDFYQGDLFGLPVCTNQTSAVLQTGFNDDSTPPNFDTGGTYNTVTGRATILLAGGYFFEHLAMWKILVNPFGVIQNRVVRLRIKLQRFDATNVLQEEFEEVRPGTSNYAALPAGTYPQTIKRYFFCDLNDYVICTAQLESICENPLLTNSAIYVNVSNGSFFTAIGTPTGGGVYKEGNADEYFVSKLEFEHPISTEVYEVLKSDLTKAIEVSHNTDQFQKGWLRKMVRNYNTGATTFELISNTENAQ